MDFSLKHLYGNGDPQPTDPTSNTHFIYRSPDVCKLHLEETKLVRKHQVLGLEHLTWDELHAHAQNHIRSHPDLGTAQLAIIVVMSTSSLATSPSLFLEAFKEPESMKGFQDPRFQKVFGDEKAWERMCKAARGELTSTVMSGTRYVTSESIPYVVETLEVHDPEAEANQMPNAYPQRPPLEDDPREAWLKRHKGFGMAELWRLE